MWSPTHIQVTVQRAKGLLIKGKNGTNNCFVTIGLGKDKYQTSLKEKAVENVDWHEECELKIPDQGNRAELVLTCLHRNNLGLDEFLGQATLPLNEMDVYDRPRSKWFKLESKPGKEKKKERGELEVRISFIVKSGSLTDLSKKEKHKSSVGQLASSVGGSLLSIGTIEKRKGIKKFAKSLGSKIHLSSKKKNKEGDTDSFTGSFASIGTPNSSGGGGGRYSQRIEEADPGVISEDEDEFVFDNLSHKSSGSSLNIRSGVHSHAPQINPSPLLGKEDERLFSRTLPPSKPPRNAAIDPKFDEWEAKLYGKHLDVSSSDSLKRRSWETSRVPLPTNEETEETESARDFQEATEAELVSENRHHENNLSEIAPSKTPEPERKAVEVVVAPRVAPRVKTSPMVEKQIKTDHFREAVDQQEMQQHPSTAPTTPVLDRSKEGLIRETEAFMNAEKQPQPAAPAAPAPTAMPRSATMECLSEKQNTTADTITTSTPTSAINNNAHKEKDTGSPMPNGKEKTDKKNRFNKFKYFNKRDKNEYFGDENGTSALSPKFNERIIIGHEKSLTPRSEISAALAKKYDGKSREELMLIANGMETEALIQRQRVKELEDYLDNLLLRVMETHPKILQNPYSRTTSTKSFKNYISMNDFL